MSYCFLCKGSIESQLKTFILELGDSIFIIKNVPTMVCSQCGQVSYSLEVSKKLEIILDKLTPIVDGVGIFEYSKLLSTVA